jgi:hypothetical protein
MAQTKTIATAALVISIIVGLGLIAAITVASIAFSNNQRTQSSLNNQPNLHTDTYNVTFTGPCTGTDYVLMSATRFGNVITISIPYASCTGSGSAAPFAASLNLDVTYRPPADVCVQLPVTSDSTAMTGSALVTTAGAITLYSAAYCAAGNFDNAGTDATGLTADTTTNTITYSAFI